MYCARVRFPQALLATWDRGMQTCMTEGCPRYLTRHDGVRLLQNKERLTPPVILFVSELAGPVVLDGALAFVH
jgi:hypothetical protein